MTDAKRDNNRITTGLATLNSDGVTSKLIEANPTSHILATSDDTTGSDNSGNDAYRDDNQIPVMLAVSESDGSTPVPLYVDSDGNLLIDSN